MFNQLVLMDLDEQGFDVQILGVKLGDILA